MVSIQHAGDLGIWSPGVDRETTARLITACSAWSRPTTGGLNKAHLLHIQLASGCQQASFLLVEHDVNSSMITVSEVYP